MFIDMAGLEKIIEKINADSEKDCASVIAAADEKAKKLESDAEAAREQMTKDILNGAEERAKEIAERGESTANQIRRQTLLKAKIETLNEVAKKALSEIKNLEDHDYFEVLSKLAVKNAKGGRGVMRLSEKDLKRLPSGFIASVTSHLPNDYEIVLSDMPADIAGGFFLVYGDIDVNCTFDALAEDRWDDLKEDICAIIFS